MASWCISDHLRDMYTLQACDSWGIFPSTSGGISLMYASFMNAPSNSSILLPSTEKQTLLDYRQDCKQVRVGRHW